MIDGDDCSLCEIVDATRLVPLDDVPWSAVPAEQRCPVCRLVVAGALDLEQP